MNLRTLGAVIKFSLELENKALAFYETNDQLGNFGKTITQYQKRIKRLQRLRRENTTEMILEPIEDFFGSPFDFSVEGVEFEDEAKVLNFAKNIENNMRNFYVQAAEKVSFLAEVAYVFEEIAEKHEI